MIKKLLLTLVCACALALCPFRTAAAETAPDYGYARIEQSGVYLYGRAEADSGLFVLPQTYFVKLTGETGDYYSVEYLSSTQSRRSVRGYCLKSQITPVDYIPETPFLVYAVDVTFRTETGTGLPDDFLTEYVLTAAFYGTFSYGSSTYYYVDLEGDFGYVPASACSPLDYPLNTEHTETETPPAEETPQSEGMSALNIVLICVLAVAALGAIYFLFRPSKSAAKDPFSDDAEDPY